jgi:myosin-1
LTDKTLAHKVEFRINHYAGDVKYQINGFIDKNKDLLYQDFKRLLYNSTNKYIKSMWPEGAQSLTEITKRPATVGTRFKNSMIGLVQNLSTKDPFYVRCIKPNDNKVPNTLDHEKVKNQVFYLGLLENVRVRRAGFAYRLTYESFLRRYKCLSKTTWPMPPNGQEPKDSTREILNELALEADVRNGVTKVFIRSPETVFHLEKKRSDRIPEIVIFIQKVSILIMKLVI